MAQTSLLIHHDFCQRRFYVTCGKHHVMRSSRLSPSLLPRVKGHAITTLEGESLEIEANNPSILDWDWNRELSSQA